MGLDVSLLSQREPKPPHQRWAAKPASHRAKFRAYHNPKDPLDPLTPRAYRPVAHPPTLNPIRTVTHKGPKSPLEPPLFQNNGHEADSNHGVTNNT